MSAVNTEKTTEAPAPADEEWFTAEAEAANCRRLFGDRAYGLDGGFVVGR
ncbi:hypothetical protein [Tessaracoccus palaemonis]|uniref:Uncharacterized protein n=1 Tax=Tessaracoccus palaemonis TaxID=2829499 RepID=A0ABX8SK39_9ACTN|nr:hypothetical protein [Tessaracoccus palaemonis]QXT63747.1 hypothetical protein KDB89_04525 [Tessaracoccus palaemonis]